MTGTWAWLAGYSPITCSTAETIYWKTPGGASIDLTDGTNYSVLRSVDGRRMVEYEPITKQYDMLEGEKYIGTKVKPRQIFLPVLVKGTTRATFLTNMRRLTKYLDPFVGGGEGTLQFCAGDLARRVIKCQLLDFDFGESKSTTTCTWQKVGLTFIAHDPYFYDPTVKQQTMATSGNTTITTSGDVPTWPKFVATGSSITAVLFTTLSYTPSLSHEVHPSPATTSVTIITQPGERSAVNAGGTPIMGSFYTTSTFFPLLPGANTVRFDYSISGTPGATCYWYDAYNGI